MGNPQLYTAPEIEYFLMDKVSSESIPKTFGSAPVILVHDLSEIIGYELERPEHFRGDFGIGRPDQAYNADLNKYGPGELPAEFIAFDAAYAKATGISLTNTYGNKTHPFFECKKNKEEIKEESKRLARSA